MAMKAGTVADFAGSLAEAMEDALKAEYQAVKGEPLPDMGRDDRRMLLVAVAQGVLRYFKENADAFEISVETTQVTGEAGAPLMRSDNPSAIAVGGGGSIGAHNADVTQIDAADNRLRTRGTATVDDIDTSGGDLYP